METNIYLILIVPLFIEFGRCFTNTEDEWSLSQWILMTPPNTWEEIETQKSSGWCKRPGAGYWRNRIPWLSRSPQCHFKSINLDCGLQELIMKTIKNNSSRSTPSSVITSGILNHAVLSHGNTFFSSKNYVALALTVLVIAAGNTLDHSVLNLQSCEMLLSEWYTEARSHSQHVTRV